MPDLTKTKERLDIGTGLTTVSELQFRSVSRARRGDGDGGEDLLEVADVAGHPEDAFLLVPELLRRHLQQRGERRVAQRLHAHHEPLGRRLVAAVAAAHQHRHATAGHAAAVAHAVREAQAPHQLPHRTYVVVVDDDGVGVPYDRLIDRSADAGELAGRVYECTGAQRTYVPDRDD